MRFDVLNQLRHRARMLNSQARELGQFPPQFGTLRLARREHGLLQHVDADEVEEIGMFLTGHGLRETHVMAREPGEARVGEAFLPLRPRHPFPVANEGKPCARNDFVFVAALAAHIHALLP